MEKSAIQMSEHIGESQEIDRTERECSLANEGRHALLVTIGSIRNEREKEPDDIRDAHRT